MKTKTKQDKVYWWAGWLVLAPYRIIKAVFLITVLFAILALVIPVMCWFPSGQKVVDEIIDYID